MGHAPLALTLHSSFARTSNDDLLIPPLVFDFNVVVFIVQECICFLPHYFEFQIDVNAFTLLMIARSSIWKSNSCLRAPLLQLCWFRMFRSFVDTFTRIERLLLKIHLLPSAGSPHTQSTWRPSIKTAPRRRTTPPASTLHARRPSLNWTQDRLVLLHVLTMSPSRFLTNPIEFHTKWETFRERMSANYPQMSSHFTVH